jgi:acetate kinase
MTGASGGTGSTGSPTSTSQGACARSPQAWQQAESSSRISAGPDPRAKLAVDHFVYRVGLNAGMLAAALGGLDAFVFTAGIGENSPAIRARIAEKLAWLGAVFDPEANANGTSQISRPESRVALLVVPTDEELMIAQHTVAQLRERSTGRATGERLAG